MMAKASLPMPFEIGSTTVSVIAAGEQHPQARLRRERLRSRDDVPRKRRASARRVGRVEYDGSYGSLKHGERGLGFRGGRERVVDIPKDIIERLQTDGDADHVGGDARLDLFLLGHLPVRGRGGMNDEGLRVADIGEMAHEACGLDEFFARLRPSLDAKVEKATCALRKIF